MKKVLFITLFMGLFYGAYSQRVTPEIMDSVSNEAFFILKYNRLHQTAFTMQTLGAGILMIDLMDNELSRFGAIAGGACIVSGYAAFWISERYLKQYAFSIEARNKELSMVYRFDLNRKLRYSLPGK